MKPDWKQLAVVAAVCLIKPVAGPLPILALQFKQKPDVQTEISTQVTRLQSHNIGTHNDATKALVQLARGGHENEIRAHFQNLIKSGRTNSDILASIPGALAAINSRNTRSDLMAMAKSNDSLLSSNARDAMASLAADKKANLPPAERQGIVNMLHGVLNDPFLKQDPAAQLRRDPVKLAGAVRTHSDAMRERASDFEAAARNLGEIAAAGNLSIADCRKALAEAKNLLKQLKTYDQGNMSGPMYVNDAISALQKEIARQTKPAVARKLQ